MIPPKKSYVTAIGLNLFLWVSLVGILLFSSPSFAQLNSNNLTLYTEKDGLPGTQINKIMVDQFGYIWVGTINGLTASMVIPSNAFMKTPTTPVRSKGLMSGPCLKTAKGEFG
jgi:ligand-binding sensor domain-containing protein